MAAYWHYIDDVWVKTPEYAGCGFGHLRRWTPERLSQARRCSIGRRRRASTDAEKSRVQLANESLQLFELFMKMRRDLAEGRFSSLTADVKQYRTSMNAAAEKYKDSYAFGQMHWTKPDSLNTRY